MTDKAKHLTIQLIEELERTTEPSPPAKPTRRYKFRYGFNREAIEYKGETLKVDFGAFFYPSELDKKKLRIEALKAEIAEVEGNGVSA